MHNNWRMKFDTIFVPSNKMSSCTILLLCGLAIAATGNPTRQKRLALPHLNWRNGVIPYEFDNLSKYGEQLFYEVVEVFNKLTCVRWLPKSDPIVTSTYTTEELTSVRGQKKSFVVRIKSHEQGVQSNGMLFRGYASVYGMMPDPYILLNTIFMDVGNDTMGPLIGLHTVLHEMMHIMGFEHEHMRADSYWYLDIDGHKPDPGMTTFGLPLDYESVMLYRHFLHNKSESAQADRKSLSKQDILIINHSYKCYPKDQNICKFIDYTNLRHFIPDEEIGNFSQFNANFTKTKKWTDTDTIRIGERCAPPYLQVGCLVESTDGSGTVKTRFADNGCWIHHNFEWVKCDLQFEGEKLTSVNFPTSELDETNQKCYILL